MEHSLYRYEDYSDEESMPFHEAYFLPKEVESN